MKTRSLGKAGVFSGGLKLISKWWKLSFNNNGPKKMCKSQTGSKMAGVHNPGLPLSERLSRVKGIIIVQAGISLVKVINC